MRDGGEWVWPPRNEGSEDPFVMLLDLLVEGARAGVMSALAVGDQLVLRCWF